MWEYTEDGSMDDNEGKEREKGGSESSNDSGITITPAMIEKERVAVKTAGNNGGTGRDIKQHAQHVFLFSLSTPKKRANAKQTKSLRH
jgi:hypothetical protein